MVSKRLIDLSGPKSPPRLLDKEFERPKGGYAALSHCWGPDPKLQDVQVELVNQAYKYGPVK